MEGISPAAQAAWERLQQIYGRPLSITSGYRDPALNAAVDGAKNSQHMHGNAFDVSAAGLSESDRLALASAARQAGFQGFGFYNNSMHFDVGGSRAWGPSFGRESVPDYAQDWVSQNIGGGAAAAAPQSGGAPMMGLLSTSTSGMPEEQPRTFGQRIKSGFQNGSLFDSMAMAFNGLRMNPDQNLGEVVGRRQEMRQQEDVMNRTVAWLQSMGTPQALQAAEALATGSIDAGSAVQYALAKPEEGQRGLVVGSNIVDPVTGEVIYQGPEKVVDDAPSAFRALDLQARAAGLQPQAEGGDGQYENFMLTRGTGYAAEASTLGSARGEAIAGAPAKAEMAGMIETQIDELLNDPYLPEMLGPYASRMPNLSGDAARVQSKMDQITGGAFLQARQLLKGGGAITDFESKKAETAFIRMNAAQNEADFRAAMEDFRSAVRSGLPKLDAPGGAVGAGGGSEGLSAEDLLFMEGN